MISRFFPRVCLVAALAGVAGLLSACGTSTPVNFYTLDAVSPATLAPLRAGPTVQLGAVTLPAMLDRVQIVRRDGSHQVAIDDLDHWAAPLDDLTRRALVHDLALRLPARVVMTTDDTPPAGPLQVMSVSVGEFAGNGSGQVVLQAHWTIFHGTPLALVRQGTEDIRVPAGTSPQALAAGMSQALGLFADKLAAALPPA
ncbi:MAG TPA: PqiC family protein [Stellaceae bacterium]|nr:PqiC family protein [Stellaceae bacterium]